jgi:hypothetical protein
MTVNQSFRWHRATHPFSVLIVCCSLFVSSAPVRAADSAPPNPSLCSPKALVTADNDIRLDGDSRPPGKMAVIPLPVMDKLHDATRQFLANVSPGAADGLSCKELFPAVFMVAAPAHRELFIAEIHPGLGASLFFLILYEPVTREVTQDPPRVGAYWPQIFGANDPLVKKPLVSFADLFQNHSPQIVFEERVHNGNMYNAVIYHYFDVGPHLALTRVLARETRVLALDPSERMFNRELTQLSPTSLRLDTVAACGTDSSRREELGYVILESPGPGVPFHVTLRHPKEPDLEAGLVTNMDESPGDDIFLREGNPFTY